MSSENTKLYFYPVWLRIWHAVNAIGIILLIITGFSLQSGIDSTFINFKLAVNIHNIAGITVAINYLLFFIGNFVTQNIKFYLIKPMGFIKRPMKQAYYYAFGMFRGMKAPYPLSEKRKFNPLQKYAYVGIMYVVVPIVIISGFALLFPEIIIEKVYTLSGVFLTAITHSAAGFFISIFLLIHLYVASIGKSPLENFKSIITGWHNIH
ncbi:MAG: cytochrome b/b6 domain-containing protein [Draconibacterium sp.]|nr:cytochrome b/b6 domain-containing protein [Draconibacterium sp.]HRA60550.1 cytochrome b/b6 domain-containing protein [Bacteroidia bacterium]